MANILNLSDWKVLEVEDTDNTYVITAQYEYPPQVCLKCGVEWPKVTVHQYLPQLYNDLPHHGKQTALRVRRKRFKCKECGGHFMQPLYDMDGEHPWTRRLSEWVKEESLRHTFAHVARQSGLDERTVRRLFEEHVERKEKTTHFVTPEWLGMDEVHLLRAARLVLANLQTFTVIEMREGTTRKEVIQALRDLPWNHRIELVTMDMTRRYKEAVRAVLGEEPVIVVDKFHVVRMASKAMEEIRRTFRADLNSRQRSVLVRDRFRMLRRGRDLEPRDRMLIQTWFTRFPLLGEAYHLKEAFYDLYDMDIAPQEAKERIEAWRASVPAHLRRSKKDFLPLVNATKNWETEILNYFSHKATNAPVEALNGGIKRMQSEGRGYSFRALRAKILYGKPHDKRPTSIRSLERGITGAAGYSPAWSDNGEWNYGVPFHTLGEDHEQGTSEG